MRKIKYPWNLKPMTNDLIRVEMKRAFFPYFDRDKPEKVKSEHEPEPENFLSDQTLNF